MREKNVTKLTTATISQGDPIHIHEQKDLFCNWFSLAIQPFQKKTSKLTPIQYGDSDGVERFRTGVLFLGDFRGVLASMGKNFISPSLFKILNKLLACIRGVLLFTTHSAKLFLNFDPWNHQIE